MLYEVRCLKSNENMILALTGQFRTYWKFQVTQRDSNPWTLQCRCSALTNIRKSVLSLSKQTPCWIMPTFPQHYKIFFFFRWLTSVKKKYQSECHLRKKYNSCLSHVIICQSTWSIFMWDSLIANKSTLMNRINWWVNVKNYCFVYR